MKIYLVIPTVRNLDFLKSWDKQFSNCHLLIIEDGSEKSVSVPHKKFESITHYSWPDIEREFGKDSWIFSRRNAGIRSYGFWKAYESGADVIITLDDDCYPVEDDFVKIHIDNLIKKAPSNWFPTFPHPEFNFTRGFPYEIRERHEVAISHGLWSHYMDLDAKTQLINPKANIKAYPPMRQFVPFGYYFPMSSMNLAFKRKVVPLMYFPLMGSDPRGYKWGYDRFDDIWAGIMLKKICDHLKLTVVNGSPFVEHKKASDPVLNLKKEARGLQFNEEFWKLVHDVKLTKNDILDCYKELTEKIKFPNEDYFRKLKRAMSIWTGMF